MKGHELERVAVVADTAVRKTAGGALALNAAQLRKLSMKNHKYFIVNERQLARTLDGCDDQNEDRSIWAMQAPDGEYLIHEWIVDSGAGYHLVPRLK